MNYNLKTKIGGKEMLDYDKIYNIYEIFTLLENMPKNTKVLCLQNQRNYILIDGNLTYTDKSNNHHWINSQCKTKELINLTFKVVKEPEKEEWVKCSFISATNFLVYNAKIKMFNKIYYGSSSLNDFIKDYGNIYYSQINPTTLDKYGKIIEPQIDLYYLQRQNKQFKKEYTCTFIGGDK